MRITGKPPYENKHFNKKAPNCDLCQLTNSNLLVQRMRIGAHIFIYRLGRKDVISLVHVFFVFYSTSNQLVHNSVEIKKVT